MRSLLISVLNDTVTVDVDFIFQYFIHYKYECFHHTLNFHETMYCDQAIIDRLNHELLEFEEESTE